MKTIEKKVSIDDSILDETREKVARLIEALKEAKSLVDDLAAGNLGITYSITQM